MSSAAAEGVTQFEFLVRVTRVRRAHARYTAFSAMVVQPEGRPVPRAPNYAVIVPGHLTPVPICTGQRWRVTGVPVATEYQTADGWRVEELRLTATTATLERTSGAHIVALLASAQFPGVGPVTAQRAWDSLGEALYDVLDAADYDTLESIVGTTYARILIDGWTYYSCSELLRWMQRVNLDVRLGRSLMKVYGRAALQRLREDPYRLLALGMSWRQADELARQHFAMEDNDPRRLGAAVEAELYEIFHRGDTFTTTDRVTHPLRRRLGGALALRAIDAAAEAGVVRSMGNRICAPGPFLLENLVGDAFASRIKQSEALFGVRDVDRLVDEFEQEEQRRTESPTFLLNEAQRRAVHKAASHNLFCLIGGAGVGKTTTLSAITFVLERAELQVYLLAPTGKAAKRMRQATKRPAMTIAGFLRNTAPKGVAQNAVIVVDEASMLDILLAYRLLTAIPPSARVILIGDSAQLPPVGPGLTLHELASSPVTPKVELTEGKRFAGRIAVAARAIRSGHWPAIGDDSTADVSFIACAPEDLPSRVVDVYLRNPLNSQVLCSTKESGAAPSKRISALCQDALADGAPRLNVYSEDRQRMEDTGFRLGDPVLCTVNLWDYDLQNGSIGRLTEIEPSPLPHYNNAGVRVDTVYGWVAWDDGERRPLTEEVLNALELAYAITVHKSQGSEVPVAIVPVYPSRNLDRTLLYTAITRARQKVVLLGDFSAAKAAVEAEPLAARRQVMLRELLESKVADHV